MSSILIKPLHEQSEGMQAGGNVCLLNNKAPLLTTTSFSNGVLAFGPKFMGVFSPAIFFGRCSGGNGLCGQ